MLNVVPAVGENVENEEHDVRLRIGIPNGIEARFTALAKCNQFSVHGSHRKCLCEGGKHLREFLGEVLPFREHR